MVRICAFLGLTLFFFASGRPLLAQQQNTTDSDAVKIGDVTVSGWLRSRGEFWDWFEAKAKNQYTFSDSLFRLSFAESTERFDWKIELAVPFLIGLPNNAIAPGAQGQLGLGGTYYASSKARNTASIFPKQAYARFKFGTEGIKQSVLLGRSEFLDGGEVTPKDTTLAALKKDRIAQRLIGPSAFADIARTFDGGTYSLDSSRTNVTVFGGRPTRGLFQVDGWNDVNVAVYYGGHDPSGGRRREQRGMAALWDRVQR